MSEGNKMNIPLSSNNLSQDKSREKNSPTAKDLCDSVFAQQLGVQGKFEEALEIFVKATELDPQYARAWLNRGWALIKLDENGEENKEAFGCFSRALEVDRKFAEEWLEKEIVLRELTEEYVRSLLSQNGDSPERALD